MAALYGSILFFSCLFLFMRANYFEPLPKTCSFTILLLDIPGVGNIMMISSDVAVFLLDLFLSRFIITAAPVEDGPPSMKLVAETPLNC